MVEIVVFAEGQTEEAFIKRVVAPSLRQLNIFLKPQTLHTSKDAKGGAINYDRLCFNARNTLRQKGEVVLTTFIDLYALDTSFPSYKEAKKKTALEARLLTLNTALHKAIVQHVGCRSDRFIPYIQPHEFEGLLFSDVERLVSVEPNWRFQKKKLDQIRANYETPEHINDGYDTKPSKRLELLKPGYRKTLHGPRAAEQISLAAIERECPHFREWMAKLRALSGTTYSSDTAPPPQTAHL